MGHGGRAQAGRSGLKIDLAKPTVISVWKQALTWISSFPWNDFSLSLERPYGLGQKCPVGAGHPQFAEPAEVKGLASRKEGRQGAPETRENATMEPTVTEPGGRLLPLDGPDLVHASAAAVEVSAVDVKRCSERVVGQFGTWHQLPIVIVRSDAQVDEIVVRVSHASRIPTREPSSPQSAPLDRLLEGHHPYPASGRPLRSDDPAPPGNHPSTARSCLPRLHTSRCSAPTVPVQWHRTAR